MEKTGEELCKERKKRVLDAVQLKEPDRVPIISNGGFFAAKYAGFTCKEAMYDREKAVEATLRYLQDFQPDLGENPFMFSLLGEQLESIGYNRLTWPGHGLDDMSSYQFLEREMMSADEYDEYLYDPTDFVIRKVWPRVYDTLKPFEQLPPLQTVTDYMSVGAFGAFIFSLSPAVSCLALLASSCLPAWKSAPISFDNLFISAWRLSWLTCCDLLSLSVSMISSIIESALKFLIFNRLINSSRFSRIKDMDSMAIRFVSE